MPDPVNKTTTAFPFGWEGEKEDRMSKPETTPDDEKASAWEWHAKCVEMADAAKARRDMRRGKNGHVVRRQFCRR